MSPNCPQCQHPAELLFHTQDINRHVSSETFNYYRCTACHLIFLYPIPDNLSQYYSNDYHLIPQSIEELDRVARWQSERVKILQRHMPQGKLLDIGPSYGSFAYLAKQAGYHVEAIEMNPDCCRFLENIVGIHTIESSNPAEVLRDLGQYDIITLWQVIEHVPDPWQLLDSAAQHLSPNGVLVIAAPNPDSIQFRLFKGQWQHVDAPRHLQLIPVSLLAERMQRHGLKAVLMTTDYSENAQVYNVDGWKVGLFYSLPAFRRKQKIVFPIGQTISKLAAPIERRGLNGATYVTVFQR